jgi:hypothetical protein
MDPEPEQRDNEIDVVLTTLRALMTGVSRPVVRACLEEAHDDIAHLVAVDTEQPENLWRIEGA